MQRTVGHTTLWQTRIGLCWSESLQRASKDPEIAATGTLADGCAVLEGRSAGHPPGTRVPQIFFLPCSPELVVVDTVSPVVPHSLVQDHTVAEAEPGLNASLWIWVQRGIRLAHGR